MHACIIYLTNIVHSTKDLLFFVALFVLPDESEMELFDFHEHKTLIDLLQLDENDWMSLKTYNNWSKTYDLKLFLVYY